MIKLNIEGNSNFEIGMYDTKLFGWLEHAVTECKIKIKNIVKLLNH